MITCYVRTACSVVVGAGFFTVSLLRADESLTPQYEHGSIVIPAAHADERNRQQVSIKLASDYLDQSALAWTR